MLTLQIRFVVASLTLVVLACAERATQQEALPSSETGNSAAAAVETTRVEGWWELGDSSGPFTAELRGADIMAVDRDLSHGDYGATRDRFEFESGRLARYRQDSDLRLMDPDDASRLVPVAMRLDFGESGDLSGGEKTVDGAMGEIEPADVERVLVQVDELVARVRSFAEVYAEGGEPLKFVCPDDTTFTVTYARDLMVLDLGRPCGRHILTRQPSASGAKYGNDLYVFWNTGDEALVEQFGKPFLSSCRVRN